MQKIPFRNQSRSEKLYVLFISQIVALCYATSYTFITMGLKSFSPSVLTFARTLAASIAFLIYALIIKMPFPSKRDIPELILSALVTFTIYNIAISTAQQTIPTGLMSVFSKSVPMSVTILALIFLKENIPAVSWGGMLLAFFGILWIVGSDGFGKFEPGPGYIWAAVMVLAASFSTIIQRRLLVRLSPGQIMAYSTWISLLTLCGTIPSFMSELQTASTESILAVLALGVTSGFVAFALWGIVLNRIPAGEAETFLYTSSPGAIIVAWIVLGEKPGINVWIGLAIIFLGMYLVGAGKKKQDIKKAEA